MSSSRWEQVKDVVATALELEEDQRPAYVEKACGTDGELRREVERLLRQEREAGTFLETPVAVVQEPSLEGTALGPYRVESRLSQGGMGVVYLARDTRLNRPLAIKVLRSHALSDPERRARFEHEARTASSLNHPNIVTVYDIGRTEGRDFLAMEFVEGRSLDKLIKRRGMPLVEALKCAVQIASALAAAHAKGIIHRDIKPANVMVTPDGLVKVLDFGIAKLTERITEEASTTWNLNYQESPTTAEGMILGTVSYMSPEQAEGKPVGAGSDVFSFGSMLYEMLTGQRAFAGETQTRVVVAILEKEPKPLSDLSRAVPPELDRIVSRCLKKATARRFQHMDDLKVALQELQEELETRGFAGESSQADGARRRPLAWTAVGLVPGLLLAGLAAWWPGSKARPEPLPQPSEPLMTFPSFAPDSKWLVYVSNKSGNMDLWKKPVTGGKELQLTATPQFDETQPAWSPADPDTIAFVASEGDGGVFLMPASGGTATRLTAFGANPRWSPDGKRLAFDWQGAIYLAHPGGGAPEALVENTSSAPPCLAWSADGKKIIYWNRTKRDLCAVSTVSSRQGHGSADSVPLRLIPAGQEVSALCCSRDNRWLIYSQGPFGGNKDLWKVAFDGVRPLGKPLRLTVSAGDEAQLDLSPQGNRLVFTVRQFERNFWSVPLDGTTGLAAGQPEPLTVGSDFNTYPAVSLPTGAGKQALVWTRQTGGQAVLYHKPLGSGEERPVTPSSDGLGREIGASFSPDGRQIVYSSTRGGSYELWRMNEIGSVTFRLTETQQNVTDAQTAWAPDGKIIAFYSNRAGNWDIWGIDALKGGPPFQLTTWESDEMYPAWHPNGRLLAFRSDREQDAKVHRAGNPDIWVMDLETKQTARYVTHPAEEAYSAWSADGRHFYFSSNRSGEFNIYVMPAQGAKPDEPAIQAVTRFKGHVRVLPAASLFTKFAVSSSQLIIPLETTRQSEIHILENLDAGNPAMQVYPLR